MLLPKLPDDMQYGLLFGYARGKAIDEVYGNKYGIKRRLFEPDVLYKRRLVKQALKEVTQ